MSVLIEDIPILKYLRLMSILRYWAARRDDSAAMRKKMRTWAGDKLLCGALILSSVASLPGCSFLFVTAPKHADPAAESSEAAGYTRHECTTSKAAPIIDSVVTGLEAARTIYAATADQSVYEKSPISRGADIALGLGFLALFGASAIWGYSVTSECASRHGYHPAHAAPPKEADEREPIDPNDDPRPPPPPKAPETDTAP